MSAGGGSTCFLDLPDASIQDVLVRLDARSLLRISTTCRRLASVAACDSLLWKPRCSAYNASSLDGWGVATFRQLYLRLLRPYGHLLGVWAGELNPLGSCMLVYLEPPRIVGAVVSCLRFREAGVSVVPVFSIEINSTTQLPVMHCLRETNTFRALTKRAGFDPTEPETREPGPHPGLVQTLDGGPSASGVSRCQAFSLTCCGGCKQHEVEAVCRWLPHGQVPLPDTVSALSPTVASVMTAGAPDFDIANQFDLEVRGMHVAWTMQDIFLTGEASYRMNTPVVYRRLASPQRPPSHWLEGFWVGTYGPHGMEVLQIAATGPQLVARKLTGDANVPAGEASFRIHSDRPGSHAARRGARFTLPAGYSSRVDLAGTEACGAADGGMLIVDAFEAQGQVAGTGYAGGRWIAAECVVLSGGLFGVMWIDLGSFSVFRRLPIPVFEPCVQS